MRNEFVAAMVQLAEKDEKIIFLSGDLGYLALEPLKEKLGDRFINAGVAEQNLVSVAAGLASRGFTPWIYSITPFIILRPLEQIRNDVCFHRLPVRIVGNGGGYAYGVMGATHHALEDVGCLQMMPGMKIFVPCYLRDVGPLVEEAQSQPGPAYVRLGRGLPGLPPETSKEWRVLKKGTAATVITSGPVVGGLLEILSRFPKNTFEVISTLRFPLSEIPASLLQKIEETGRLITLEEHLGKGGLGENIAHQLLGKLKVPIQYLSLHAKGYLSGRYGSQQWHLQESGLAGENLYQEIHRFLEGRDGR